MRNRFQRAHNIFHVLGYVLQTLGVVFLVPLIAVFVYWGQRGDGWDTVQAFALPSVLSFTIGHFLRTLFRPTGLGMAGSMIVCGLGWACASAMGALPFVIGIGSSYLNGYFEAMSGFTTTGITVLSGLDGLPRSILLWRALSQWVGGVGILSFFLVITFRGSGAHHIFGAESHKISATRPAPGLYHTVKILWGIYLAFTLLFALALCMMKMPVFDSLCHCMTGVSTGGFSPYDASIAHYGLTGHPHYRLLEYTLILMMMVGGINFLVHYRVVTRDFKALWDNIEIRWWWRFVAGFTVLVMVDHFRKHGLPASAGVFESVFRDSLFQVTAILTTTGFATRDIASDFFPALAKQLFLVMMVIGGCVGSTSGGIKVLRSVILGRLMLRELYRLRVPARASTALVIDKRKVSDDESHRTAALFFMWIVLLAIGGGITALLSNQGALESFSGMFSALGNIGPCYISVDGMINMNPVVKITYIFGMLAGRLEILPVLLLFSRKAWRG
jgi:trk system potassium uptake protein TrkH